MKVLFLDIDGATDMKQHKHCPVCMSPHVKRGKYCSARCFHSLPRTEESRESEYKARGMVAVTELIEQ